MSIVSLPELSHDFSVGLGTLLGCHYSVRLLKVQKLLSRLNRLQPVSDHDHSDLLSLLLLNLRDSLLHLGLALRVERAGCLVKHEDLRLLYQRPSNRDALLLPA
mmetsp:Transcript_9302/g.12654  ORF Transcript_9302/g.12654 Transcript_9302/m.12654 type:complete len:104 (-) Transcript_9302:322-633(-)